MKLKFMQDEVFKMYNLEQIMKLLDWINEGKWCKHIRGYWYSQINIDNIGGKYTIYQILQMFERDCKI